MSLARRVAERSRTWSRTLVAGLAILLPAAAAAQPASSGSSDAADQTPRFEDNVDVVSVTPLHGLGVGRNQMPANVQTLTATTLERTGGVSLTERMLLGAQSVHVNETTTNPFQPDLQFRGFAGSSLLGLPQGVAVYQNGVRMNEPFGDTVNWDLVPTNAIASVNLMPGSNPLFGLNALGGAVSVQTKTGFSHPGHSVEYSAGSFGRQMVSAQTGGHRERLSYFVAGNVLTENGWRNESPSRVRQLFGDVEWRREATTLNATLSSAANRLIGNGAAPIQLLQEDRSAIFTYPDETKTRMAMVTLRGRHRASSSVMIDALAYYRRASIATFNGDHSDYGECERPAFAGWLCPGDGGGNPVEDQFERFVPADDDDELNATNNTSRTVTNGSGATFQATVIAPVTGRANHFVTGASLDMGRSGYQADTEIARLTETRGTEGTGLFDRAATVRLRTRVRHLGGYAADFFNVTPELTVMGAARINHSDIVLRDQVGDDLNGAHTFTRVNPAVGATYLLPVDVTAYGSLSISSRAPAPSELSCADPEDPCRLPNAFVADPPLDQVVARTFEGGLRGGRQRFNWTASVFRTTNRNDIMFISSGPLTNTGHFENVGRTRRTGLELGGSGSQRSMVWGVAYSYLQARFAAPMTVSSPNHPEAEGGEIGVAAGDHIPSIPQHNLKLNVAGTLGRLTIGGNLVSTSTQYLRGDENNRLPAVAGVRLLSLTANYALNRFARITGRVTNLLGSEYATFGLLGEAGEVLGDRYDDPRFLSPGAPRAAWVGLSLSLR